MKYVNMTKEELIKALIELKEHNACLKKLAKIHTGELQRASDQLEREITWRKRAEEELRLSEERFSKAFNSTPGTMAIITFTDGRYIDVNDGFLSITGYRREEVIGRTTLELNVYVDPKEHPRLKQMIQEHGAFRNLEINFRTKSGEVRVGLVSAETIALNGEQCILVLMNDITERKQMETEMARLERLNLVGEMAASIGHEIRNPMTTVRGFLQVLKGKKGCNQYKDYFDLMVEELDHANSIISQFISLAKDRGLNKEMQNLNTIIEAIFPLIQANVFEADMYINWEPGDIPDLLLDKKEIRQLVLNLVRNGVEAMSPGGNLTVKTFTDNGDVVLSVQDEGTGIEPGVLEKIGTPFFTTKDNGTGLGLAVCHSIAARHNAVIDMDTGPNGTTVFVRFKL